MVEFLEKGTKSAKIWANFGVLSRGVGIPRSSVGPRRDGAERMLGKDSGTPRRSKATLRRRPTLRRSTIHNMEIFGVLFCFVFPLLRGLVY